MWFDDGGSDCETNVDQRRGTDFQDDDFDDDDEYGDDEYGNNRYRYKYRYIYEWNKISIVDIYRYTNAKHHNDDDRTMYIIYKSREGIYAS